MLRMHQEAETASLPGLDEACKGWGRETMASNVEVWRKSGTNWVWLGPDPPTEKDILELCGKDDLPALVES